MLRENLEVCLLCHGGRAALLRFAMALALKRPLRAPLVQMLTVDKVRIDGEGVAVQVDGDDFGCLPARIEAVPRAVTLVLPAKTTC